MTHGVVFYVKSGNLDFLIPAALLSLRKVYQGPVHVVYKDLPEATVAGFKAVSNLTMSPESDNLFTGSRGKAGNWCRKAYHHMSDYPYGINMYYDWDHIWYNPIDETVFDRAREKGLCATVHPLAPQIDRRKDLILKGIMGRPAGAPAYRGLNGGFVTAVKGHPIIHEWMARLEKVRTSNTALARNPEEFALTSLYWDVTVEDPYKTSLCFDLSPGYRGPQEHIYKCCAAHGSLRKVFYLHEFWKSWDEVKKTNFMGCGDRLKAEKTMAKAYNYWYGHYSAKHVTPEAPK